MAMLFLMPMPMLIMRAMEKVVMAENVNALKDCKTFAWGNVLKLKWMNQKWITLSMMIIDFSDCIDIYH